MRVFELSAGPASLLVDPERGGRVASLTIDGLDVLRGERDDVLRWGSYPMAPWAGRVRHGRFAFRGREHRLPLRMPPHAIHGTTLDRPWQRASDRELSIDLGPDWPFRGRAIQRFALDADQLSMVLRVESDGEPFPASLGFHPWFVRQLARGAPLELEFEAREMYLRDDDGIPNGERVRPGPRPWDDCFVAPLAPPRLRWPGALSLRLDSSHDHWVVYDEPEDALCVEPLTGPPDALNIAQEIVEPGQPLTLTMRIAWTIESSDATRA